jgi:hypothetical protein
MKCIKAVKDNKYKVGEIIRVSDRDADEKVASGYWNYVSKSEWKEFSKKSVEPEILDGKTPEKLKKNQKTKQIDKKVKNPKKNLEK